MPNNVRIIIIGGGASGIAAASRLIKSGFTNLKILEAESRLGGRILTKSFGKNYIDLGAHWVHGEKGNIVHELALGSGALFHSEFGKNVQFICDDRTEIHPDIGMTLYKESSSLTKTDSLKQSNGNLSDYIIPKYKEVVKKFINDNDIVNAYANWAVKFETSIEGCDELSDVSVTGLSNYTECDGDSTLAWKNGGYSSIIHIFMGTHPVIPPEVKTEWSDKILLNTKVKEIDWNGLVALVKCSNGTIYRADHVIFTPSLGVLKENYKTLFNPQIPEEKINSIRGLGIGTVDKIFIKFDKQWWPDNCSGFSLLYKNDEILEDEMGWENQIFGFYAECTAPLVLCGWITGAGARDMETYGDEQVKTACYKLLKRFLGHKYDIPEPVDIIKSSWFSNPNFRGSYSYHSVATDVLKTNRKHLRSPLKNIYGKELVFFAGEATHDYYYSTVHGAIETGFREAQRIINKYQMTKSAL